MFQMMMIRPHVFHTRIQAFPFEQKEFLSHFIRFSKIYIFSIQLYFNQFPTNNFSVKSYIQTPCIEFIYYKT